ncbi:branched-chain amino acid ABC transporter substrate-binding protein [Paraburkholderia sediminicola]|uniref:branched-chain amino acid ABC transporter substrate-binding protein n=1 Tax=Paraburkholderia sediminicola TaxID=458836 RepID=UPI0038BC2210
MKVFCLTLAGALVAGPLSLPSALADTVVKIGVAGPLTGSLAQSGKDDERGVQLAINELNAQKVTIAGQPVTFQMISQNDQADPKIGVTVAQQFVDLGVSAVIGHYNSGVTIPAAKIYNDAHIPMITATASNPQLTQLGYTYVYRLGANDNTMGSRMAVFAAKTLHAKRVAVVDDRTAYGTGVADVFVDAAKKAGLEIVDREYTNDKATDFKAILTNIKPAKPDVIFYGGYYTQAGYLGRQMKTLQIDAALLGGDGICAPDVAKLADGALEGKMYCAQGGAPLKSIAGGETFREKFKKTFDADVDVYAPACYTATLTVVKAMQQANSTDPQKFAPLLKTSTFPSMLGPVKFDQTGEWVNPPVTVYKLTGSALVPLATQ